MTDYTYPEVRILYFTNMLGREEATGIRDRGGLLLQFNSVTRYPDQPERYERELAERQLLADRLLACLQEATND